MKIKIKQRSVKSTILKLLKEIRNIKRDYRKLNKEMIELKKSIKESTANHFEVMEF